MSTQAEKQVEPFKHARDFVTASEVEIVLRRQEYTKLWETHLPSRGELVAWMKSDTGLLFTLIPAVGGVKFYEEVDGLAVLDRERASAGYSIPRGRGVL